ncbi:MAG: DNA recombination protein RmuC, partial [Patescibacteria group bacterium]
MATFIYVAIFAGGVILGAIVLYFLTKKSESFLLLQQELQHVSRQLDEKLGESGKMMHSHFVESSRNTREVIEHVARLDEVGKQVVNFADQLARLQDILKNPKQRGILGEYYLDALLSKAFQPNQYKMQYKFRDGEIVDAALFFGDQIIPIDSKFSLENYNRISEE